MEPRIQRMPRHIPSISVVHGHDVPTTVKASLQIVFPGSPNAGPHAKYPPTDTATPAHVVVIVPLQAGQGNDTGKIGSFTEQGSRDSSSAARHMPAVVLGTCEKQRPSTIKSDCS